MERGVAVKRSGNSPLGLYTIGIAALFLAGFFLLVVFGAQTYRNTVEVQTNNNRNRALLSYFQTCVRSSDSAGSVYTVDSEYGPVLIVQDEDTGYGLHIFCWNGQLMEDYAALDAAPDPDRAQMIANTSVFDIESMPNDSICITTDAGKSLIHIRSEGSGFAP